MQWPAPATIENQFLLLDQPTHLPLLTFASIVFKPKADGTGRQKMSLLAIDKRNGRVAYKASFPNSMGLLDITGDVGKKAVDLVMQRDTAPADVHRQAVARCVGGRAQAGAAVERGQEHRRSLEVGQEDVWS